MSSSSIAIMRDLLKSSDNCGDWFGSTKKTSLFGDDLNQLLLESADNDADDCAPELETSKANTPDSVLTMHSEARKRETDAQINHYQSQWENYCKEHNITPQRIMDLTAEPDDSEECQMLMAISALIAEAQDATDEGYIRAVEEARKMKLLMDTREQASLESLSYAFVEKMSEGDFDSPQHKEYDELFSVGGKVMIIPTNHVEEGVLSFIVSDLLYEQFENGCGRKPKHKIFQYPGKLGIYYWESDEMTQEEVREFLETVLQAKQIFITDLPCTYESYLQHMRTEDVDSDK